MQHGVVPVVQLLGTRNPRHIVGSHVTGAVNSLGVVLGQELERYNRLLHHVSASLQQLTKALKVLPPA